MFIDVLIIGSGGAGLSAALNAKKEINNILVLSKAYPTHSQTCQAQGGINAILTANEADIEKFIDDTYKASRNIGIKENIKLLCEESLTSIKWLDDIGVPFSRDENSNIAQRKFGGTKEKRTCYSSDYTGLKIVHTLYDQCIKEDIKFLNEYLLLNLIVEKNRVKGAIALDILNGEIIKINAKSVILAGGGYAGIYSKNTTNSYATTGDIIAIALKAGAKLSNMEFIQFHPTSLENKNILISESARGEGGYLIDENGNRFIDELKPRDEVARAIYEKNLKKERVFLDLRHLDEELINQAIPQERRLIKEFSGLDLKKDLIPVSPSAHYSMGGIKTDKQMQTSIENLYACGECAQSGVHGANRLGGNSLQEIITFGRIAGKNAALKAIKEEFSEIKEDYLINEQKRVDKLFKIEGSKNFYETKKKLGEVLFNKVGLFREENKLKEALEYINNINTKEFHLKDKSKTYNKNLVELLEFENSLLLCEPIIKLAINRKESRGTHFRVEFKESKEEYEKESICYIKNGKLFLEFKEIV